MTTKVSLGELLRQHFDDSLLSVICERFGYQSGWRTYSLDDCRSLHWLRTEHEVAYNHEAFTKESTLEGAFSSGVICGSDRVFEVEGFVMALVDTQCDGNVFLMVFDAAKECKDQEIVHIYKEFWGCGS